MLIELARKSPQNLAAECGANQKSQMLSFLCHLCRIKKLGSFTPEMNYRLFDIVSRRGKLVKGNSKISLSF